MNAEKWQGKVANSVQLGGIETSVLDNGAGRGTRIAWLNTGTGLRCKIIMDRAMDIGEAFYNQHSLAWLSNLGIIPPERFSNKGIDWLETFGGGLLTTCGLTHVGGPETDEFGERGLHGHIGNIPAEIESIIQPDLIAGKLEMSITGRIKETRIFGPSLELRRTISAKIGESKIWIHDEVVNCANTPSPHMLLYHFNLGWPLVDEGADILWKGEWKARESGINNKIFKEGNNFRKCLGPIDDHLGSGEEAAFINVTPDENGKCIGGLSNKDLGIDLLIKFRKDQLPWLTNWQHWGKGEYVCGLEPGTNPPIGQAKARAQNELIFLQPGEKRVYDIEVEVTNYQTK